jgi:hypothetical protein
MEMSVVCLRSRTIRFSQVALYEGVTFKSQFSLSMQLFEENQQNPVD